MEYFRICDCEGLGVVGGVFSDFVAARCWGVVGGVFSGFAAARGWEVVGGVFADFVAEMGEEWVECFQILWLQGVVGGVFSDLAASGRKRRLRRGAISGRAAVCGRRRAPPRR